MGNINFGRLLLGGLLAGLVINIGEIIFNVPIAGAQFEAAMAQLGLTPPSGGAIAVFILSSFGIGILSVALYAAFRQRLGTGPKTAITAGVFVWLLAYLYPSVAMAVLNIMPDSLVLMGVLWGLIEIPLATVVGSRVYRRSEAEAGYAVRPAKA